MKRRLTLLAAAAQLIAASAMAAPASKAPLSDWPRLKSAVAPDAALEARIREIVAGMTLEQKIGQMTQSEIKTTKPDDVRKYYLGSVLNGVRLTTFLSVPLPPSPISSAMRCGSRPVVRAASRTRLETSGRAAGS